MDGTGAIPPFGRKPANDQHRHIREGTCIVQESCRNVWLYSKAGSLSFCALPGDILLVIGRKRGKQLHLSLNFFDLQALENTPDIGTRNITAASSAFDIVHLGFAEYCQFLATTEWQKAFFIFQKYHALRRSSSGKGNVRGTACDALTVFTEAVTGHKLDSLPFRFLHEHFPLEKYREYLLYQKKGHESIRRRLF